MKKTSAFALAAVSTLLSTAVARGVDYRFTGVVNSVLGPISSEFQVGEIVSGHMSLTPTQFGTSEWRPYAVSNFSANIGGDYAIGFGPNTHAEFGVLNDIGDFFDQVKLDVITPSAPMVNGHTPDYFNFNLLYEVEDLSSTDLVPQFVLNSPFDRSNLRFDVNDSIEVRFTLTDFSVVPEPPAATLALCLCALAAAVLFRRRGH